MRANDSPGLIALRCTLYAGCAFVLAFLVLPIVAIVPLSFNSGAFLTYPLEGFSLRWYADFFSSPAWLAATRNSVVVAAAVTVLATPLGTLAALGLLRLRSRLQPLLFGLLVSPLIIPLIVTAIAIYLLYAPLGLNNSFPGLILAHTTVAVPYVVVVVYAALHGLDIRQLRAAASLGAGPARVFLSVLLPQVRPGVVAGAVFAFMTSFDEIITTLFIAGPGQRTLPLQMFAGAREQLSPTITAAATLLVLTSVALLGTVELLRRRAQRVHQGMGQGMGAP